MSVGMFRSCLCPWVSYEEWGMWWGWMRRMKVNEHKRVSANTEHRGPHAMQSVQPPPYNFYNLPLTRLVCSLAEQGVIQPSHAGLLVLKRHKMGATYTSVFHGMRNVVWFGSHHSGVLRLYLVCIVYCCIQRVISSWHCRRQTLLVPAY
jgi:hypothetical protein